VLRASGTLGGEGPARRLPYVPGLDGLRALAVLAVLLYHAGVSFARGGFLGVDLFFVLSGFLITSLLLGELAQTGRIDLRGFWLRRARRLLPAVAVLIPVTLVAASTLARDDVGKTRDDAIASLLYVNNWHQVAASQSYFASLGRPSLLQHLWSLAVEEQFYVLWPLLLAAGLVLLRRRGLALLTLVAGAGSALLMAGLYDDGRDPSRVYYGTDTRASALLIGALLAFAWPAGSAREDGPARRRVLDVVGLAALAAVLAAFWRVNDYDPFDYRGGLVLFALAAAALIGVVSRPTTRLGRALGWPPLVWLGIRSYGIYLWHWPVLELSRPGRDVPWHGPLLILAQTAVTIGLAALSYRFVEQPVRRGALERRLRGWRERRSRRGVLAAAAVTAAAAAVALGGVFALPPGGHAAVRSLASPAALRPVPHAPPAPRPIALLRHWVRPGKVQQVRHVTPRTQARRARGAAPLPPGKILAIGDSVMLGCTKELRQRLGPRLTVDAAISRQAEDLVARLRSYRSNGVLPDTVIVQLGDNGPIWYRDLAALRRALSSVPRVVLVNARVDRSWQGEVLRELSTYQRGWSHSRLADWYGHSSDAMLQDGVHPGPGGCRVYADVIATALHGFPPA
jgi:peptidoglycan/LPS O-acetylase OafA/YrhL